MAIVRPIQKADKVLVDDGAIKENLRDLEYALSQQQYDVAKAVLRVILTAMPGVKSKNVAFLNTLTSLREAVDTGEMSLRDMSRELKTEFTGYKLAVLKMVEEVNTPTQKDELSINDLLDHAGHALTQYEQTRDQIEKDLLARGFVVTRAPVMPLSTPPLDVAKLAKNGFKSDTFAGYPIVHAQFVVGISQERVYKEVDELAGHKLADVGKSPTEAQRQEVYENVLDSVRSQFSKHRLMQVGSPHHWYDATWFWLLPESHFKLLKSCTISETPVQSLSIKKWSFPFRGK